jgi:hypothetical protein
MIKGIKNIDKVIQKLQRRQAVINSLEGKVDIGKTASFVPGPFLHQDVKDEDGNLKMSERESAQFEQDNQEIFDFIRGIYRQINRSVEG